MQIERRHFIFFQHERGFSNKCAGLAVEEMDAASAVIDKPFRPFFQLEDARILSVCYLIDGRNCSHVLGLTETLLGRGRDKPDSGRSIDPCKSVRHSKEMVERRTVFGFSPSERQSAVVVLCNDCVGVSRLLQNAACWRC